MKLGKRAPLEIILLSFPQTFACLPCVRGVRSHRNWFPSRQELACWCSFILSQPINARRRWCTYMPAEMTAQRFAVANIHRWWLPNLIARKLSLKWVLSYHSPCSVVLVTFFTHFNFYMGIRTVVCCVSTYKALTYQTRYSLPVNFHPHHAIDISIYIAIQPYLRERGVDESNWYRIIEKLKLNSHWHINRQSTPGYNYMFRTYLNHPFPQVPINQTDSLPRMFFLKSNTSERYCWYAENFHFVRILLRPPRRPSP